MPLCDDPHADEGADYARALSDRIAAGTASPEKLASLMQFLHSGSLLHGAAVVIFEARRSAAMPRPAK
jgi:hypothetical protein